tara:strand:+ start:19253 stop:19756 length:504 start_codon:yes stop_codon:yes gene_type:complete
MVAQLVNTIQEYSQYKDALEGAKNQLTAIAKPAFNKANAGKADPSTGIIAKGDGKEVLVSVTSYYSGVSDPAVLEAVAPGLSDSFNRKYSITIKSDKLPKHSEEGLLSDLVELFNRYGATDALEVKDSYVPKEGFHTSRHVSLTEEQNNRLDALAKCRVAVKVKGRK